MIAFVTGLQNPMGIIIKNQFGTSNFLSQLGNAQLYAYAFMGIPAGLLLQRIGYKAALTAIAVGFIGVELSIFRTGFGVYLSGAFVSGFSMCISIQWSTPC